jgi:signal recognition particle subunit SEC65
MSDLVLDYADEEEAPPSLSSGGSSFPSYPASSSPQPPAAPAQPTPAQIAQMQAQRRQQIEQQLAACKHFVCIYPAYLEEGNTVAQGRRLPKRQLAGCNRVNVQDIGEAVLSLGLNCLLEGKRYPRSDFTVHGRVRCELKSKEGVQKHATIASKEQLLVELARIIPTMESRRRRNEEIQRREAEALKEHMARKGPQPKPLPAPPKSSEKKKGGK